MRSILLGSVVLLLHAAPASAQWHFSTDEDPFSDETTAFIAGPAEGGVAIGAKCWKGQPDETILMIMTPIPFDRSASYKDSIDIKIRVDTMAVRELSFKPHEMSGDLGFITAQGIQPDVLDSIREWGEARKRIAFQLETSNQQASAQGSSKAVRQFLEACSLDEVAD